MSSGPEERGRRTSDYQFDLPEDRIAQQPASQRDESRLLVVPRDGTGFEHRRFRDVVDLFSPGDILVVNETRVFPARLLGRRPGGGEAEILLLHPAGDDAHWVALVRPGSKLRAGKVVEIAPDLSVEIAEVLESGERRVRIVSDLPLDEALARHGQVPLPPYVRRPATAGDVERYQTVYARERGSVAAPTAGLHFTPELLEQLEGRGIGTARLVLHVGVGTFRPVESDDPAEHPMHREWYSVSPEAAASINAARRSGAAIWAVGTTSVRTLETVADDAGEVHPGSGWTDIFIRPPYSFLAVDRLITNFHLPKSTLLMLVAALAGYETTMAAYEEAVREGYRFYSYGDAMVVV